jgi:hypothetical protein
MIYSDVFPWPCVRILRQKTTETHVKKYCIDYLDSIGSFAYTRQVLVELENRWISFYFWIKSDKSR